MWRSIFLSVLAGPAVACDLALALAVDTSGSVDAREYATQMQGLALALRDGSVADALVRARATVALVQWTGGSRQATTIPWTDASTHAAVAALADRIAGDPRVWRNFSTAIGEALEHTAREFAAVPQCRRRVIDLSGDGLSNEGIAPRRTHAALRAAGITVNALAIEESEADLTAYFWENVITGDGAFVVTAAGFEQYPEKIKQKLLREVTQQVSMLGDPR